MPAASPTPSAEGTLSVVVSVKGNDPMKPVAILSVSNIDTIHGDGGVVHIAPGGISATPDMTAP